MVFLKYIRLSLLPFSLLYGMIIRFRNFLFDIGKLQSHSFNVPIISVGNITVGGTGKTPLTEFIISLLKDNYHLALLSRGYKRKTKGVVLSNENSTAQDIGDEPMQVKQKFSNILVAVAEKRVDGIQAMLSSPQPPEVIIMDDAYQHRYVKPGLSILVMDFNRPLWKDCMLPAGELREPIKGKVRANIILVSKCPFSLSQQQQLNIIKKLNMATDQSVYFSSIGYQKPFSLFCTHAELKESEILKYDVLLVTGIANPAPLHQHIKDKVKSVHSIQFSDHHHFESSDIEKITAAFEKIKGTNKIIFTTEKDAVRLKQILHADDKISSHIWIIPIKIKILNNQNKEFTAKITSYVKQNKGKR
jgi:tetraacyldisaccharide 4'-kinase